MAHVTGGGITDNLPRVLPAGTHALIRVGSWPIPDLFHFLQETGEIDAEEMLRVFNLGIGLILVVAPNGLAEVLGLLRSVGQKSFVIGTVQPGGSGVVYDLGPEAPLAPTSG
jgi:phosphoribosylformylglycinamidine cyclo-ligase